ncbi:MAG: hypothetical protein LBE92_19710 [Chryseobacterium sp.]|uniref:hypothetical protein n=1 Tax=Chryseobacterium sp. TaxID=1871047 RepID=UPI00281D4546|nr:hypothetical protein [Chryseobacterium sp.]MDR2238358.1 hypothetical protein [Chryseobacterium sp.]
MKTWTYFFLLLVMITSCSGHSAPKNLTWYKNATISDVTEDPDHPETVMRVAIGISQQVFYVSKKNEDRMILNKVNQSFKSGKAFDIGIENNTNIIKEMREVKNTP